MAGHVICGRDSRETVTFVPRKQTGNEKKQEDCPSTVTRQTTDSEELIKAKEVLDDDGDDNSTDIDEGDNVMRMMMFLLEALMKLDVVLTCRPSASAP